MKRNIAIIIHVLAVLIVAASSALLGGYSREDIGIAWTDESSFEDSLLLSELVADDITNLKRYAVLKNAFEDEADGEVDDTRTVVIAVTQNGRTSYKLSDLVSQAARYGYTIDSATHRISVRELSSEETPYELTITYKLYDPYYLDNIAVGPTRGVTNIRDLSIDALRTLAEYYSLDTEYAGKMSNFLYRMSFVTDSGAELYIDNTSLSTDEIRSLGKYLIVSHDSSIETNIDPAPGNIFSGTGFFTLSAIDGNLAEIGVDTDYIFEDRYREASEKFAEDVDFVKRCLYMLLAGAVLAAASIVPAVRGFSESERRELILDEIPLEALVFCFGLFAVALYAVFKFTVNNIFEELLRYADWQRWRTISKGVIVWFCSAAIIGSMYRRSLYGGVFGHSLAKGVFDALTDERKGQTARNAFKGYGAFVLVNVSAAAGSAFLFVNAPGHPMYGKAAWILIFCLMALDIFVYILRLKNKRQIDRLRLATGKIARGETDISLCEEDFDHSAREMAHNLNCISEGLKAAVDEQVRADRLKTDLITNVSHDIRTPLTSIINYVDLLKRENPEDPTISGYIDVLEQKSERLKNLTEDLIEASKASSGNVKLEMKRIDMGELAVQAGGELSDKFTSRELFLEIGIPEEACFVLADGRHLWRVFENLYNNAAKYALPGTRVYADVLCEGTGPAAKYIFTIKNVSAEKLNISPEELTERFVRGDVSRNTEGSGLGLSIARSLTELMGGKLVLVIDGDLFKASVIFKPLTESDEPEEEAAEETGEGAPAEVS